jgi:cytochrome c oxidase subunit 2
MTNWLGLPPLASTHGGQIDGLIGWMHVFMFVLFVGWGGFLAYILVRFRRSRHPVANYTGVTSHASTYSEIAVAVIEAILLFAFSIPIWAARVDRMPPENDALVVRVTAEQFAWNIHYAGPDRVFGRTDVKLLDLQSNPLGIDRTDPAAKDDITTLNQLYLPANTPIIVRLRSKDVIHSFGVPEFRVKQDAVPGLTIPIWFIPDVTTAEMRTRTGNPEFQYEIACAQLCGMGHYRMRGLRPPDPLTPSLALRGCSKRPELRRGTGSTRQRATARAPSPGPGRRSSLGPRRATRVPELSPWPHPTDHPRRR